LATSVVAYEPLWILLGGQQSLRLVFFHWEPGDYPLEVDSPSLDVTAADSEFLRSVGVRGSICGLGWSIIGRGPQATALILLRGGMEGPITLPQPDKTTIVYQFWAGKPHLLPRQANTRDATILLRFDERLSEWGYEVLSAGATQGGGIGLERHLRRHDAE
jgi:hypothetical protein